MHSRVRRKIPLPDKISVALLFLGQNTHDTAYVSAMDGYKKNDCHLSGMTAPYNLNNCHCYSDLPYTEDCISLA